MCCATRVFLVLVSLFFAASCYKSEQAAARRPPKQEVLRETTAEPTSDLIPKGWEVEVVDGVAQDVEPTVTDISRLKFKSFLKDGENYIGGGTMRQRAVELRCTLGLSDAKYFLDNQDQIPVELRGKYIILPGTVLRRPSGGLNVPCILWNGVRWELRWFWLVDRFWSHDRLACSQ